jgi:hypothetical protein
MMLKHGLFVLLACAAGAAAAEDRYFLAGGEGASASYYSYIGVVLPGPGRETAAVSCSATGSTSSATSTTARRDA